MKHGMLPHRKKGLLFSYSVIGMGLAVCSNYNIRNCAKRQVIFAQFLRINMENNEDGKRIGNMDHARCC